MLGSAAVLAAAIAIPLTGWLLARRGRLGAPSPSSSCRARSRLLRQSAHILLEGAPGDIDVAARARRASSRVPGIEAIHDLHFWTLTSGRALGERPHPGARGHAPAPRCSRAVQMLLQGGGGRRPCDDPGRVGRRDDVPRVEPGARVTSVRGRTARCEQGGSDEVLHRDPVRGSFWRARSWRSYLATGALQRRGDEAAVEDGGADRDVRPESVGRQARAVETKNPIPATPEAWKAGLAHYRENCVTCHGAPGVDASEIGQGLNPPAPDLTLPRVQARPDGELFWIVSNGIRDDRHARVLPDAQARGDLEDRRVPPPPAGAVGRGAEDPRARRRTRSTTTRRPRRPPRSPAAPSPTPHTHAPGTPPHKH